jgi:hypothetical protein
MERAVADGAGVLLAALLIVAGGLKIAQPVQFGAALQRLVPRPWLGSRLWRPRALARLVGALECGIGGALVVTTSGAAVAASVGSAVLFSCFVAVVVIAIRKGESCGCWASLSDGPAGGAELGRALWLGAIAWARVLIGSGTPSVGRPAVLAAAALFAGMAISASIGASLRPVLPGKVREQPRPNLARTLFLLGAVVSNGADVKLASPQRQAVPVEALQDRVRQLRDDPTVLALHDFLDGHGRRLEWERATGYNRPLQPGQKAAKSALSIVVPSGSDGQVILVVPEGQSVAAFGHIPAATFVATDGKLKATPIVRPATTLVASA